MVFLISFFCVISIIGLFCFGKFLIQEQFRLSKIGVLVLKNMEACLDCDLDKRIVKYRNIDVRCVSNYIFVLCKDECKSFWIEEFNIMDVYSIKCKFKKDLAKYQKVFFNKNQKELKQREKREKIITLLGK